MIRDRRCTVGVLTPYTGGFYYGSVLEGVARMAREYDAQVVAFHTTRLDLHWPDGNDYLALDAIDGWLVVNEFDSAPFTTELVRRGLPLVCVNARPATPGT
jgi:DNA-binding LacI/PurR family transcriptional regulator